MNTTLHPYFTIHHVSDNVVVAIWLRLSDRLLRRLLLAFSAPPDALTPTLLPDIVDEHVVFIDKLGHISI